MPGLKSKIWTQVGTTGPTYKSIESAQIRSLNPSEHSKLESWYTLGWNTTRLKSGEGIRFVRAALGAAISHLRAPTQIRDAHDGPGQYNMFANYGGRSLPDGTVSFPCWRTRAFYLYNGWTTISE